MTRPMERDMEKRTTQYVICRYYMYVEMSNMEALLPDTDP